MNNPSQESLVDEFASWKSEQGLPDEAGVYDLLDRTDLTPAQREWLEDFNRRYDAAHG